MFDEKGFIAWLVPTDDFFKNMITEIDIDKNIENVKFEDRKITLYDLGKNSYLVSKLNNNEFKLIILDDNGCLQNTTLLENSLFVLPYKTKAKAVKTLEYIRDVNYFDRNMKLYSYDNKILLIFEFDNNDVDKSDLEFLKTSLPFKVEFFYNPNK